MVFTAVDHYEAVILIGLLLVSTTLPSTIATASTDAASISEAHSALEQSNALQGAKNNTTNRHRNPEQINKNGDLNEVQRWLVNRLAGRLNKGAINLSQGEYRLAKNVISEKYRNQLGKYVEVAGETDRERDNQAAELLNETKKSHNEYTSTVQAYRETLEKYQEARQNGNITKARSLARRLNELAESINKTGTKLIENYQTIENLTSADLRTAEQITTNITSNITTQQAEIRKDLFINTTLTARAKTEHISFLEPLIVRGQLTAENGTPIRNGVILLQAGKQTIKVRTNESGRYRLQYRPTLLRLDIDRLTLRYRPRNESRYLDSSSTVSISVNQTTPTVEITEAPTEVAFSDELTIKGTVSVKDIEANGVPIVVFIGERRLGTARTASDGTFTVALSGLPADIPPGKQELRVGILLENRALASVDTTRPVTIEETTTSLSLDGKQTGNRLINLAGRLTTEDGRPVPDRSIVIQMRGRVIGTVTTNATGVFEETVTVPESRIANADGNISIGLVATFDGTGTNLNSAQAETMVVLSTINKAQRSIPTIDKIQRSIPTWVWIILGFILVAGILSSWYALREHTPWNREGSEKVEPEDTDSMTVNSEDDVESPDDRLLSLARDRLNAGRGDEAIQMSYRAVRMQLEATIDNVRPRTHWEFYRACREAGLDDDYLDSLRRLTEVYERAAFAPTSVSVETAAEILESSQIFQEYDPMK